MTNRIAIRLAMAATLAFAAPTFAQNLEVKSLPATEMAQFVPEPAVTPAAPKPAMVADTSFQPAVSMPSTASSWPWIAVGGILALLGAVAMMARRRLLVPIPA